ncbi:YezD family protein [Oceanobacillus jeddahense]|uniref:YezD family protein n=1 Tax=Oceanobacillus jeddahense TaxID=1462527 RepID=A0ABY5JNV9_9BACI|nr:YezD family protein [Oceanobacillus jeddahense]UUI01968.1 YezD family protein [Oceanobacillus jeddahense]
MSKEHEVDDFYVKLKELLNDLNFGTITIVVQDGKVIQLEKSEKVRLK